MAMGNGPEAPKIKVASDVELLAERLMTDIRSGNVDSLAIVVVNDKGQMGTSATGGRLGDMYIGAAMLQEQLMQAMTSPDRQKQPSRIIKPFGMNK